MRSQSILRIVRQLPPKVQLGIGVLAVVAFGVMWMTGTLPKDGNFLANEQGQGQDRATTHARRSVSTDNGSANTQRRTERTNTASSKRTKRGASASNGNYDYLALALSWSPTYCETSGRGRKDRQCSGQRPYAFVVHGLWPQHNKGWPENCRTGGKPFVPNDVIRSMLDIMPSRGLIIHEYKKHGTCSGLDAAGYFDLSRELYNQIKIPPRYIRPDRAFQTSPREVENDFLRANPGMSAGMISVVCGRKGRLKELRICFAKSGEMRNCGQNENQRKLCSRSQIRVPPVRTGRRS